MNNYHEFQSRSYCPYAECIKCGATRSNEPHEGDQPHHETDDEQCPAWVVQIPDGDGTEEIGYAETAEQAQELAKLRGYDETPTLYARLDYCEWHVGF